VIKVIAVYKNLAVDMCNGCGCKFSCILTSRVTLSLQELRTNLGPLPTSVCVALLKSTT